MFSLILSFFLVETSMKLEEIKSFFLLFLFCRVNTKFEHEQNRTIGVKTEPRTTIAFFSVTLLPLLPSSVFLPLSF